MAKDESIYAAVEQFLNDRPLPPRLLALGEPFHGEETFPCLRNDLLRGLVRRQGYGAVVLESDCLAGRLVDDYVHGGDGRLDQVMTNGFSHEFGAFPANRALVTWLREHNEERPAAERVRFAGFDAPLEISEKSGAHSPRVALRMLHTFLTTNGVAVQHSWRRIDALLGADAPWTNPAATMDPTQSIGDSAEVRELRSITDDLGELLRTVVAAAELTTVGGREALWDAELAARTADGLLAYHMALAGTDFEERLTRCTGIRAAMMTANLDALTVRERDAGRGPILAFAHNEHLRRTTKRPRGADYAAIATAIGSAPHLGIDPPPPNTLEGVLAATGSAPRLVAANELRALVELVTGVGELTTRPSGRPGYFPLGPDALDDYDAVLFLPRIPTRAG